MKKLYFFSLLLGSLSFGQIVDIPDANFKNILLTTNCADFTGVYYPYVWQSADLNGDDEIQVSEAHAVQALHFIGTGINSLQGLEAFSSIHWLDVYGLNISDTSQIEGMSALDHLDISSFAGNAFNFDQLFNLVTFNCTNCNFTTLDLSHTKVTHFNFNGSNGLTYVNLKNGYLGDCSYGLMMAAPSGF